MVFVASWFNEFEPSAAFEADEDGAAGEGEGEGLGRLAAVPAGQPGAALDQRDHGLLVAGPRGQAGRAAPRGAHRPPCTVSAAAAARSAAA